LRLFLHIGYHKTGSSYIQTLFSTNRELLLDHRIFYPISKDDRKAKKGLISPGNAIDLVHSFKKEDYKTAKMLLTNWVSHAKGHNCNALLLSSEQLFPQFAKNNGVIEFLNECLANNILSDVSGLIFVRDPIEHIFSLYKHKGKNGAITNFSKWTEINYKTLEETGLFFDIIKSSPISWTCKKYTKNPSFLSEVVFTNWLNIPVPEIPANKYINVSLTLSEIGVMRELYKKRQYALITRLRKELLELPMDLKSNEVLLEQYYIQTINPWLASQKKVIDQVNSNISRKEDQLSVEILDKKNNKSLSENLTFSPHQLSVILKQLNSFPVYRTKLFDKVKKRLRKLANR